MTIPDFQTLMLPLLSILSDGQEHNLSEVIETLARQFQLADSERNEMLPSGRQSRFNNRVGWAQTHLAKAGLLERTGRGKFHISQRGMTVLENPPDRIDIHYLMQYPEFIQFRSASRQ